jgi:uncharacterized damage-inducible protein DinB
MGRQGVAVLPVHRFRRRLGQRWRTVHIAPRWREGREGIPRHGIRIGQGDAKRFDDRLDVVEREVIGVAEAMPEEKYGFVPTQGEFKGVRSFAQQIKHLAAANYQLGARILGEDPPNGEHGEQAPANIVTKAAVIKYAKGSFAYLRRAAATIHTIPSPQLDALIDAIAHSSNHYGQMVEYLRMNGLVPLPN